MNLMELFKSFQSRAIVNKYPSSARVLYDALLFDFNGKYWPEHCIYSERGLSEMAGLSKTTTHDALIYLAERGHISIRTSKRQTVIRLIEPLDTRATDSRPIADRKPTDNRPITDQSPTNRRPIADQASGLSIAHVREDKDIRQDNTSSSDGARTRTDTVNAEDELVETWLANNGAPVTAELLSYLSVLVAKYGLKRTGELIRSAASNYGGDYRMTPVFLRKHIQLLEGGSTREQKRKVVSISRQYSHPDTRFDSEFGL